MKISEKEYGKDYPYTIDNVDIKVADRYPSAVYIEDESGNKYAVNGNAHVYFTNINKDPKYKGYTTKILKDRASDADILKFGFNMYAIDQAFKYAKHKQKILKLKNIISIILLIFFTGSMLLFTLNKGIFWGIMSIIYLIQFYEVQNNMGAKL